MNAPARLRPKRLCLGRDATRIEQLMLDVQRKLHVFGRGGALAFAMSAVDIALWDLAGKAAGLLLSRLLSLPDLLTEFGFSARAFRSAEEFLESDTLAETKCLILDVAMPGTTGPELQQELRRRGRSIPIVYITALRDETVRPRLIGQGAVECLFKPFSDAALQDALETALRMG